MPSPLNLVINLYEQVHCARYERVVNQKQPVSERRPAWLDFQLIKLMWRYRSLPEVGPAFKVFKEEVLPEKEERKKSNSALQKDEIVIENTQLC